MDFYTISFGFLSGVKLISLVFLSDLVVVALCALLLAHESLFKVVSELFTVPLQLSVLFL